MSRQAVDITPNDHHNLPRLLNNLANDLGLRYKRTGKIEDLEEAIRISRQTVDVKFKTGKAKD